MLALSATAQAPSRDEIGMNLKRWAGTVMLMLAFSGVIAADQKAARQPASVAIYLLNDPKITSDEAAKTPLADLRLADRPLVTSNDVLYYDRAKCNFYLRSDTAGAIVEVVGTAYGGLSTVNGWKSWSISTATIPVVVVVNGQRQFLAALYGDDYIFRMSWPVGTPATQPAPELMGKSNWNLSIPTRIETLNLLRPWGNAEDGDPRDDPGFLGVLKEAGKMDSAALARPRMTAGEVVAAARQMNINYPYKTASQPLPDDWKCQTVAFCIDLHVNVPSNNIIGLTWLPPLHCIWVVQFVPPQSERSTQPSTEAAKSILSVRGRQEEWCLVDDSTSRTLRIYRPLYAKSLTVKDADTLMIGPIATTQEVREAVRSELAQVYEPMFLESAEILPVTDRDPKFRFWTPMHRLWLCKGKDSSGAERMLLLSDRVPHYRGPDIVLKGEFQMRRSIPWRQETSLPPCPGRVPAAKEGQSGEIKPVADEALWKVFQTVLVECTDYEARVKAVQEAIQKDRERALSVVAFYLDQEATRGNALRFVWHLKDSRLVPFVVEAMRRSDGRTLLESVRTARAWGDRRFLPVLIEHALNSDYDSITMYPAPVGAEIHHESVFAEAAAAIYTMTKGWAGSDQYRKDPLIAKEKRNELIAQWRTWWAENKARWEAGTPLDENPNVPKKQPPAVSSINPRNADIPSAIEDWIRLLEADDLQKASKRWAKDNEAAQQMEKFWSNLIRCNKQFDYRKWVESAKNAHGITTFKVGGHEYGFMHTDWEKTLDGWRISHVWICR